MRKDLLPPREKGLVCLRPLTGCPKPALGTEFLTPLALGSWEGNRQSYACRASHLFCIQMLLLFHFTSGLSYPLKIVKFSGHTMNQQLGMHEENLDLLDSSPALCTAQE